MLKITRNIIKIILKTCVMNKSKSGRKNKLPVDDYLSVIGYVLKTGIQWYNLRESLHYTTYHKKFIKWNKHNIFQNAFYLLVKLMKLKNILDNDELKNLFVDCSMIKNVKGVDLIGSNHYDRYRNGSKVSVIVTRNGYPLGIKISGSNRHDSNMVIDNLNDIKIKIIGSRLIGDKGYISKKLKKQLKDKRQIILVHPYRKNQKLKLTSSNIKLLKKRHIVENTFSWLQNFKKLKMRYDIDSSNFIQFYYLGLIEMVINKLKNKNITSLF